MRNNMSSKENSAIAYCAANGFDWDKLTTGILKKFPNTQQLSKELLYVQEGEDKTSLECLIFEYGCVIFFNTEAPIRADLSKVIYSYARNKYAKVEQEVFTLSTDTKTSIKGSNLTLQHNALQDKVAISYAITQSVKLNQYENIAENILKDLRGETTTLARYGRVIIERSSALKKTGQIFMLKAQINLYSDLLDTPDYFWERHEAEKVFLTTKEEMDIPRRLENLNKRLDMMQELYEMLAEQIKHGHFIMLEVTIVILISIEVVYTLAHWWGHI